MLLVQIWVLNRFTAPTGMIMHHQSSLSFGVANCGERIRVIYAIVICCEQSVIVPDTFWLTCDFYTGNNKQTIADGSFLGKFNRFVQILLWFNISFLFTL